MEISSTDSQVCIRKDLGEKKLEKVDWVPSSPLLATERLGPHSVK